MVTLEYRYDIVPGKIKEYEKYRNKAGKDIWLKFSGVRAVRTYQSLLGGSSPQRVVQVDLDNLAALESILANPAFRKAKDTFHGLVTNLTDSLLVPVEERKK
ncbi:MAG: hypothetical protein Kow00128_23690 [Deltaproteobacteria bacterium]